jgi:Flp pilus assembly protein protease CpaA
MSGDLPVVEDGILLALPPAVMWAGVLCWFDCKERRLPNWLTLGGAGVALVWRLGYGDDIHLFLQGFVAATAAGLFLLLPFLMRGAGGGDVKMLFAAGAIVGLARVLMMIVVTSLAGVLLGVVMLLTGRLDGARLKHYLRCLFDWRYDRKAGAALLPPRESEKVRIPFSIPIAAGMVAAMLVP